MRYFSVKITTTMSLVFCFIVLAVGYRDSTIGTDTLGYITHYNKLLSNNNFHSNFEYLYAFCARLFALVQVPSGIFLSFISLVSFVILVSISIKIIELIPGRVSVYKLYLLLISLLFLSPFFYNVQVNVIRQGVSLFLLILFNILLLYRANVLYLVLVLLCAVGFHSTSVIFILFSPLIFFSYTVVFNCAAFVALLYVTGIFTWLMQWISSHFPLDVYGMITSYGATSDYKSGIRVDFAALTFSMGFMFYYLAKYFFSRDDLPIFLNFLKIYWILSIPFFFFGFAAYSDRYLLPAWVYISVLGAVFLSLSLRKYNIPIAWYVLLFSISSLFFILRVQGFIGI